MTQEIKIGMYVTDQSASGKYDTAIYRVTGTYGTDHHVVEYVGAMRNGRLEHSYGDRSITHRKTANLREYR